MNYAHYCDVAELLDFPGPELAARGRALVDFLRDNYPDAAAEVADSAPMADRALESTQSNARLHGCLDGLATHERAALRGAFFDGNTYEDLAARMSVPLGTMKSWIRRAMIKLKSCLEQ